MKRLGNGIDIFKMIGLLSSLAAVICTMMHYITFLCSWYALNTHVIYTLNQVVIFRDGTYLTLKEVFKSLDLTG